MTRIGKVPEKVKKKNLDKISYEVYPLSVCTKEGIMAKVLSHTTQKNGKVIKFSPTRLLAFRTQCGFSRSELVYQFYQRGLKLSESTIQSWEQGHTVPGADDLAVLASILAFRIPDVYEPT
jgi:DNA-binding transcriptional regulator YiaG